VNWYAKEDNGEYARSWNWAEMARVMRLSGVVSNHVEGSCRVSVADTYCYDALDQQIGPIVSWVAKHNDSANFR
jgi:hypothetical protein